jgi:pimeloyl-ACP methyl ester carboxylesterase
MVDGLGFDKYVAHGSDLGAGITAQLARIFPESVAAIHLATPAVPRPPEPWSKTTIQHFREVDDWIAEEGGYMHMHSTKPATLSAALRDSPVGLAAWIGEKIVAWSDTNEIGQSTFDRELLLSTLTLYWTMDTIHSSFLPYWKFRHSPTGGLIADGQEPTPTAISVFGGEVVPFAKLPRDLASRYFNLSHWFEHERGGHFPAVAEPDLLAKTLREVFRPIR